MMRSRRFSLSPSEGERAGVRGNRASDGILMEIGQEIICFHRSNWDRGLLWRLVGQFLGQSQALACALDPLFGCEPGEAIGLCLPQCVHAWPPVLRHSET